MKCRALSVLGRDPQTATIRLHYGTADGQPHAAALRFCGEEGVESDPRGTTGVVRTVRSGPQAKLRMTGKLLPAFLNCPVPGIR